MFFRKSHDWWNHHVQKYKCVEDMGLGNQRRLKYDMLISG